MTEKPHKRPEEAMGETILTDGEVETLWQLWKAKHHADLIRMVEAMVLAKVNLSKTV